MMRQGIGVRLLLPEMEATLLFPRNGLQPHVMKRQAALMIRSNRGARFSRGTIARQVTYHYYHDRVLFASIGAISGGLVISKLLNKVAMEASVMKKNTSWYRDDHEEDSWSGFFRASVASTRRDIERGLEDDNKKVLAGIIAVNTLVFGLWRASANNPVLGKWMWKHFACSYNAITHGRRFHTLLTSAFSHITLPHFGVNMFMLWEFGQHILAPRNTKDSWYNRAMEKSKFVNAFRDAMANRQTQLLSLEKFMTLYLSSAFMSSALSIVVSKFRGTPGVLTIGASGAVMGVFTVYCLLFPERQLMLYGFVNMSAAEMLQLTTVVNLIGSAFQRNLSIDFTGHLGGQGVGFVLHETAALP